MDSVTLGTVIIVCIIPFVLSVDQCYVTLHIDPIYIFFGEQTNLSCTLNYSTTSVTSFENSIYIGKGNNQNISISSFVSTNDTLTAYGHDVVSVNSVNKGVGILPYYCSSPLCESQTARQYLNVEHRPLKVNNGSCLVYNWQNMTCVWDLEVIYLHARTRDISITVNYNNSMLRNFSHLDYDVTLHWSVNTHLSPCKHMRIEGKCLTCEVKENDDKDSYKRGTYVFVVNVTNNIRPEANVSSYFKFNTDELVQPAAIENIKTTVNKTEVLLSWTHSKPYVSLRFKIEYKSEWENSWKEKLFRRIIDDVDLRIKLTKEMGLKLKDLTPFTRYDIRVSCIPIDIVSEEIKGFWSEYTLTSATTLEDVPSEVPVILPSFFSCADVDCKEIEIYWKPIKKEDKRCAIMKYKIEVVSPVLPHSGLVYATEESVSAKLQLLANYTHNITVIPFNGQTNEFPDLPPAVLVIPPRSQRPHAPLYLEVLNEGQSSRNVTLTWTYPDSLESRPFNGDFTVFWCKMNDKRVCQGEFNWLITVVNTSRVVVSEGTTVDDYMYGIAANGYYQGVSSSSGITWADCIHFTGRTISEKLDAKLVLDELDQGTIKITWSQYTCAEFRGHVIQYRLKYCLLISCEDTSVLLNISRDVRNYTLRSLPPAKYRAWVTAISDAGAGPSRELDFVIYEGQMASGLIESEDGATKTIIIVVVVLVISVLIIIVTYCLWKHCRHFEEPHIILPEIRKEIEEYYSKHSQTTSGRGSAAFSSNEPSPLSPDASTYSSSSGDSGCIHVDDTRPRYDVTGGTGSEYHTLQIVSSHPPEHLQKQYYGENEFPIKGERGETTGFDVPDSSDKRHLLKTKLDPVDEESAENSDLDSKNRSSVCEELQSLVREADASSAEIELYSIEDISSVLDQHSGDDNSEESKICSGSLPEYLHVPHATSVCNSKNPAVFSYNTVLEGGYVPNDTAVGINYCKS